MQNSENKNPLVPSDSSISEIRNYEIDRTISYTKNAVGGIRRLSVAVAIDDTNNLLMVIHGQVKI